MQNRSQDLEAIVLSRRNYSEADRFITCFTLSQGKITVLAKGVRRLNSKKRPALEPGNHVRLHIKTSGTTPLLTQAQLLNSFSGAKQNLVKLTQSFQILEIIDVLTVSQQPHPQIFYHLIQTLDCLQSPGNHKPELITFIKDTLEQLGFGYPSSDSEALLRDHLESIIQRRLKSKTFLT